MSEYNIQMNKYNALNAEYDQLYPQPMKHASTHAKDGDDPITPSSIGAAELGEDGKVLTSQLPSMEVDAYTKVQTLSDTTKTLFGLDATAVPDDALALLSRFHKGLGNEYVWNKTKSETVYSINKHANALVNPIAFYASNSPNSPKYSELTYGKSVEIKENAIVLQNTFVPTSEPTKSNASYWIGLLPFYVLYTNGSIYYLDTYKQSDTTYVKLSGYETAINSSIVIKNYGYVNSPDPNAYPPAVSDGYTYTPLGQIGRLLNHVGTVSYTGTGVSSVTVLTEFKAKFAIICSKSVISSRWRIAFAVGNYGGFQVGIADINNSDSGLYRVTSSMTDASITITSPYDTSAINESSKAYLLTYFG